MPTLHLPTRQGCQAENPILVPHSLESIVSTSQAARNISRQEWNPHGLPHQLEASETGAPLLSKTCLAEAWEKSEICGRVSLLERIASQEGKE